MASGYFTAEQPTGIDLTAHDNGDASPMEDFITLFVKAGFQGNSTLGIQLGNPTGYKDNAVFTAYAQNKPQPSSTLGLASLLEVENSQVDLLGRDRFASVTDQDKLSAATAEKTWVIPVSEWQYLTIPKRLFVVNNAFDFANVNTVRISFNNVAKTTACFSDIFLFGGGVDHSGGAATAQGTSDAASSGLQGTYKYKLTYKNSTTGNRSNPTAATQVAKNVNRAGVTLSNIPVSADAQVDFVEVWRTVGSGSSDYFKIAEIANGVTSFVDEVADHDSLDSTPGVAVMTNEALQFDNDVPDSDFDQHVILRLRSYWISSTVGKRGRLFFSPVGRPESFDGFIEVSKAGDPLHRLAVLNGTLYIFSESKVYRIDEDSAGFLLSREIGGVPGVQFAQRRTVVATPKGLFWQATDGIRAFDGTRSILVNPDPIQRVFRGESAEGLSAFEGTVATFARGEYFISDGTQCLAVNIEDIGWRNVGFGDITAFFYEYDTDKLVAGRTSNTQLIEEEGVFTDAGSSIPVEWETPAMDGPNDAVVVVERVFIDMDPDSNTITPILVHRFDTITLTAQSGSGRRTFEDEVQVMVLKPSVRLTGNAASQVAVYDIELEVRNLVLGINLQGGNRIEVTGRYREDVGSGQIVFEIHPDQNATTDLTQLGRLFIIDRFVVESNTNSTDVVPSLILLNTTVTLATITTSARGFTEYDLDRVGQLQEVRLAGDFTVAGTLPSIYRVEIYLRELELGMVIDTNTGEPRRRGVPCRAAVPTTALNFEVPPGDRSWDDAAVAMIIDRVTFDINTDSTALTPVIQRKTGGAITLTDVNTSARNHVTQQVDRMGTVVQFDLQGDFITNAVQPYGIEMYFRPVILGLNVTSGERRIQQVARTNDPSGGLTWEIQPLKQEFSELGSLYWVERVVVEANTNSNDLALTYTDGLGNSITIGTVNNAARGYTEFSVERPGPIRAVVTTTDLTQDIELYGIEMFIRPVALTVSDRTGSAGVNVKHDGKMIDQTSGLTFDVDPFRNELDGDAFVPLIELLILDANTGGNSVTPRIVTEIGTIILEAFSSTTRETKVYDVHRIGNIQEVQLQGDFASGIAIYDLQVLVRSLELGINVTSNAQ